MTWIHESELAQDGAVAEALGRYGAHGRIDALRAEERHRRRVAAARALGASSCQDDPFADPIGRRAIGKALRRLVERTDGTIAVRRARQRHALILWMLLRGMTPAQIADALGCKRYPHRHRPRFRAPHAAYQWIARAKAALRDELESMMIPGGSNG